METQKPALTFNNISERVVNSYITHLSQLTPVIPEHLSPEEVVNLQISQNELHNFFRAFFQRAYDTPELFGLPVKQDVYMVPGYSKEEKRVVSKQFKKPRVTMEYGIDFLYLVGKQGVLANGMIHLDKLSYDAFFAKGPRVKRKFLKGLESVDLTLTEQDEGVLVSNPQYPNMIAALKSLAEAFAQNEDTRMAKFLFSRCDFKMLAADYQPDVLDMLRPLLSTASYENAINIHQTLSEMSYTSAISFGSVHEWKIQYKGKRKIKSTPFFEFEYDERQEKQLMMRVKCASTNRLVPLLHDQPDSLQEDFYHHAHNCAGDSCGWCKTRKALNPSVIKYSGNKRTICWWMQRHFDTIDAEAVYLVKQYALFHDALLAT